MVRKRSEHYVNNKEFLAAIVEYKYLIKLAEEKGNPKPVIPRYLGECFMNNRFQCERLWVRFQDPSICHPHRHRHYHKKALIWPRLAILLGTLYQKFGKLR